MTTLRFKIVRVGWKRKIFAYNVSTPSWVDIAIIKLRPPHRQSEQRKWTLNFCKKDRWELAGKENILKDKSQMQSIIIKIFKQYSWNSVPDNADFSININGEKAEFIPLKFEGEIDIKPQELVAKLGIDLSQYGYLQDVEDIFHHPSRFLGKESTQTYKFEKSDFENLEMITDSRCNTGEIWEDVKNNIFYLILGKTSTEDFVLSLGGATTSAGDIEKGVIKTLEKDGNINCDHFIGSPNALKVD